MTADPDSHILVTIPNVTLHAISGVETGDLSLICITIEHDTPAGSTESVDLILHLNNHVYPIDPSIPLSLKYLPNGERTYSFQPTESRPGSHTLVHLTIPPPGNDTHLKDANEILDHVLAQYADLSQDADGLPPVPSYDQAVSTQFAGRHLDDPQLRGHLILLDESNGQIVGELPQTLNLNEDPTLLASSQGGSEKKGEDGKAAPVVLELPPDVYDAYMSGKGTFTGEGQELLETREIFVKVIPPEERDWMTRGAGAISTAISASTTLVITGISAASDYYIAHSKAYTPPDPSKTPSTSGSASGSGTATPKEKAKGNTPHPALTTAHALSEKASWASSKTAELVDGIIKRAVGGNKAGSSSKDASGNKKPIRMRDKLMLSAGLVLATVDDSAKRLLDAGSEKLVAVVGHKFGPQAQQNTRLATHTTKNVVLVYVDMQGFARRALIKKAGTEFVKARFKGKKDRGY